MSLPSYEATEGLTENGEIKHIRVLGRYILPCRGTESAISGHLCPFPPEHVSAHV